jgi:hypothetical protein
MAALKGAFLNFSAGILGALPNIVVFQFNPDRMTRTPKLVRPPAPDTGAGHKNTSEQPGKPGETIGFTLKVDASDQLASSNPIAAASGILPTLSALELLMMPKSALTIDLFGLSGGSAPATHPPDKLPTVLFFWGPFRILPVHITTLVINEMLYDTLLNPVRAEVTVSLEALTPDQIGDDTISNGAYDYTLGVKQVMAALNLANAVEFGVSAALSFSL